MRKKIKKSQIIIYKAEDGQTKIDVRFENETVWLARGNWFVTSSQNLEITKNFLILKIHF